MEKILLHNCFYAHPKNNLPITTESEFLDHINKGKCILSKIIVYKLNFISHSIYKINKTLCWPATKRYFAMKKQKVRTFELL